MLPEGFAAPQAPESYGVFKSCCRHLPRCLGNQTTVFAGDETLAVADRSSSGFSVCKLNHAMSFGHVYVP